MYVSRSRISVVGFTAFLLLSLLTSCSGESSDLESPSPQVDPSSIPGASGPSWIGTKQFGIAGSNGRASGNAIATDASGNVFVAGDTNGSMDGSTVVANGTYHAYVIKYNALGEKQWARQIGSGRGNGVATDSIGNVYLAGFTGTSLDGDPVTGIFDAFLTKYDSSGTKQWTAQWGMVSESMQGNAVTVDASNNIFVAGGVTGNPGTMVFVTKINPSGAWQWNHYLNSSGHTSIGRGVKTDTSGNIYVAGTTDGYLDGNTLSGPQDAFLIKYNSAGTKQWTKQLGSSPNYTQGNGVTTDTLGDIYLVGQTEAALDGVSFPPGWDLFVTKYNASGTKLWTRQTGMSAKDTFGNAIASDASNKIYVTGYTQGGLDGNTITSPPDVLVVKYDSFGTKLWTRQLGIPGGASVQGLGIAMDSAGSAFVAGTTYGGFDGNSLIGIADSFITKYNASGVKQ